MDALLASYAAGSLPAPLHALVGAHLEMVPDNRSYVRSLEDSLARELGRTHARPVADRDQRLNAIFGIEDVMRTSSGLLAEPSGDPKSLVHFLGRPIDAIECRTVLPGVQERLFDLEDGMRAMLYRIRAGKALPQHTHDGAEVTLVIRGAFSDKTGRYVRGDVAITDEEIDHVPVAEQGEECVCFAVIDAPLRLTGPVGRFFNRFLKH